MRIKTIALRPTKDFLNTQIAALTVNQKQQLLAAVGAYVTRLQNQTNPNVTGELSSLADTLLGGLNSLTPELLAAVGARYSRNNEGLDAILETVHKISSQKGPDAAVDAIFNMLDYGHASIADMAQGIAIFMDGISAYMAYHMFSICPVCGGQESSTRYITMDSQHPLIPMENLGITGKRAELLQNAARTRLTFYHQACEIWSQIKKTNPELVRIPETIRSNPAKTKQVDRMEKNFVLDRARVFLPATLRTNIVIVQHARDWARVCKLLDSSPLCEAQKLGEQIRDQLQLTAPRLVKHSRRDDATVLTLQDELEIIQATAQAIKDKLDAIPDDPFIELSYPKDHLGCPADKTTKMQNALRHHPNRYALAGSYLQRTQIRFGWKAVGFAEIRDFNRHRTGTKYCDLIPQGFYAALDQLPKEFHGHEEKIARLTAMSKETAKTTRQLALQAVAHQKDPTYPYGLAFGSQCYFEQATTADKYVYEMELRTGIGSHYRYAEHCRKSLQLFYEKEPGTKGIILEGSAEPE
jgi:thymidylate synthase ThyX